MTLPKQNKRPLYDNRYLIARRTMQIGILLLFVGGNQWGWKILTGNLSAGKIFETIHLADTYAVLQMLFTGFIPHEHLLIGAGTSLILYSILFGRVFCSWVCPMNILTDTIVWVRKKLKIYKHDYKIPVKRRIRYAVLGLGLVLSITSGVAAFELISPVSTLHRSIIYGFSFGSLMVIFIIVFFDMFMLQNGWCGYFCPIGAFYSLVSHFRVLKVQHDHKKCTRCNECFKACPEKQVLGIIGKQTGAIKSGECTNCARCIEACHDDALHFSILKLNDKVKKDVIV